MKPRNHSNSSQVANGIRIEMISRGVSRNDLSALTSLKAETISNLICGNNTSPKGRFAIETALAHPFWHGVNEFEKMRRAAAEKQALRELTASSNTTSIRKKKRAIGTAGKSRSQPLQEGRLQ